MAEPAKTKMPTPDAKAPASEPLSREQVEAMTRRVIARYSRVMAKLAE